MRAGVSKINPNPFTTRPEIEGTFGVVTSTHWIATAVGMGVLEKGGNAFDAAVATAFTLQVVEPHLNGPGGDVPVILYDVRKGKPEVDLRAGAGAAGARPSRISARSASTWCRAPGCSPACVPGMFDTWMLLLRDYGTHAARRRAGAGDLLCAQRLSASSSAPAATIAMVEDLFREHWPTSAAVYLPGGKVPAPGIAVHQHHARRHLHPRAARGGKRRRRPRRADRARAQDLVAGLRRRGDRQILPHAGA